MNTHLLSDFVNLPSLLEGLWGQVQPLMDLFIQGNKQFQSRGQLQIFSDLRFMSLSLELSFSPKNQHNFSFTYLQSHRLSQKVLCEHNALRQDLLSAQLHNILLFFSFSYSILLPSSLVTEKQNSTCNLPSPTSFIFFWPSIFPLYLLQSQYRMSLLVPLTLLWLQMQTHPPWLLIPIIGFSVTNTGSFTMQEETKSPLVPLFCFQQCLTCAA